MRRLVPEDEMVESHGMGFPCLLITFSFLHILLAMRRDLVSAVDSAGFWGTQELRGTKAWLCRVGQVTPTPVHIGLCKDSRQGIFPFNCGVVEFDVYTCYGLDLEWLSESHWLKAWFLDWHSEEVISPVGEPSGKRLGPWVSTLEKGTATLALSYFSLFYSWQPWGKHFL